MSTQAEIVERQIEKLRQILEEVRTELSSVQGDELSDLLDVFYTERGRDRNCLLGRVLAGVIVYYENGGK